MQISRVISGGQIIVPIGTLSDILYFIRIIEQ